MGLIIVIDRGRRIKSTPLIINFSMSPSSPHLLSFLLLFLTLSTFQYFCHHTSKSWNIYKDGKNSVRFTREFSTCLTRKFNFRIFPLNSLKWNFIPQQYVVQYLPSTIVPWDKVFSLMLGLRFISKKLTTSRTFHFQSWTFY